MSNSADQLIYRAAELLDQNKVEQAIDKLQEAITVAEVSNRPLELVRAHTILGELLTQIEENELAVEEFRGVIKAAEAIHGGAGARRRGSCVGEKMARGADERGRVIDCSNVRLFECSI